MDCQDLASIDISLRRYSGGIEIRNFSDAGNNMSIDLSSGNIILDSTCSAGTIVCRGVGTLTDNSTGTCTVVNTGLTQGYHLTETWQNQGMDPDNVLTITDTSISVGGKTLTIAQPDPDTTTVTSS